jgi:hypothetical protein
MNNDLMYSLLERPSLNQRCAGAQLVKERLRGELVSRGVVPSVAHSVSAIVEVFLKGVEGGRGHRGQTRDSAGMAPSQIRRPAPGPAAPGWVQPRLPPLSASVPP